MQICPETIQCKYAQRPETLLPMVESFKVTGKSQILAVTLLIPYKFSIPILHNF